MMKSTQASIDAMEALYAEVMTKLPRTELWKKAVTSSSIYCKTQDGYSLRIGDHKGKEKYSYKWNLGPKYPQKGVWKKEFNNVDKKTYWRFYTSSVETLAQLVEQNEKRNGTCETSSFKYKSCDFDIAQSLQALAQGSQFQNLDNIPDEATICKMMAEKIFLYRSKKQIEQAAASEVFIVSKYLEAGYDEIDSVWSTNKDAKEAQISLVSCGYGATVKHFKVQRK